MADDKLNAGTKANTPPEAAPPPGQRNPSVQEPVKSPDKPPRNEQAVIPDMVKEAPAPAGKVIDLSSIQVATDHDGKESTAPDVTAKPPEAVPDQKRRGRPPKEQDAVSAGKKEARNRTSIRNGAGPVRFPTGQRGVCSCQSIHKRGGRICQRQMPFLLLMGLKYPPPLRSHKTQRPLGRSSRFCSHPLWRRPHPPGPESSLSSPRNRGIIMVGVVPMHLDKFKKPAY